MSWLRRKRMTPKRVFEQPSKRKQRKQAKRRLWSDYKKGGERDER